MSKFWLAVFLLVGILYAAQKGYIPEAQKYLTEIEQKIKDLSTEEMVQKEGYLKTYPVRVTYDVTTERTKDFFGKTETHRKLILHFRNSGSETVSFVVGDVVIIDEKDRKYSPGVVLLTIAVYPDSTTSTSLLFDDMPDRGTLILEIYKIRGVKVGYETGLDLERAETFRMPFKYK